MIDLAAITSSAIDRVWKHKLEMGQIDEATFKAETDYLLTALKESMGDPILMKYSDTRLDTVQAMRRNVFTFVAFKGHRRVSDMVDLLEVNGKLRSKSDFVREARLVSEDYNKTWLTAEYDTVVASGQTAAQWKDFERNKDLLPFLLYKTQGDSRVRDSHSVLHDVCKPVDDPFWDEYYPPNGWRCRCYVLQVAKEEGKSEPESEPSTDEVKPIFRNNPGKTGVIFTPEHPYFQDEAVKPYKKSILSAMRQILVKEDVYDKVYQDPSTSATLDIHVTHNNKREMEDNIRIGKVLASNSHSGKLLPYDDGQSGKPQPDYQFNTGEIADFKMSGGGIAFKRQIIDAISQKAGVVVIEMPKLTKMAEDTIARYKGEISIWTIVDGRLDKH